MRLVEIAAGSLAILSIFATACGERSGSRPNVILISIDCLNQRQFESALDGEYAPALAALAGDSIGFTRAYSHAPWTTPSHLSMLTGLYPSQHGRDIPYGLMIRWNDYYPRVPNFETLGDRLHAEGYDTAAFVGQGSISGTYGIEQGFDVFEEHRKAKGSMTDLVSNIEDTEAWLAERGGDPFFLFLHTYDLHEPRPTGFDSDRDTLQYIDQYLARFVLQLKSQGLYDSSLIILTGDHGSNMIETDGKCCVHGAGHYEENLKVPLVVKLPGSSEARTEDRLVRHVDLFPTVLEVTGVATQYDGPGVSLLSDASNDVVSFSEADGRCSMRRAITTDRYKYIYTLAGETQALLQGNEHFFDETCKDTCRDVPTEELYDLYKDPFEKQNLLEGKLNEERASQLDHLRVEMATHLNLPRKFTESVVVGPRRGLSSEEQNELLESLRTLGYIQ